VFADRTVNEINESLAGGRAQNASMASEWYVYLMRCADDSFYTGVTTDPERRLRQHNGELVGGARYTRARRPVQLVYQERCASRQEACQREYRLRRLSAREKRRLATWNVTKRSS